MSNLEELEEQVAQLQTQLDAMKSQTPSNKLSMIVFSGDLDKALAGDLEANLDFLNRAISQGPITTTKITQERPT